MGNKFDHEKYENEKKKFYIYYCNKCNARQQHNECTSPNSLKCDTCQSINFMITPKGTIKVKFKTKDSGVIKYRLSPT